MRKRTLALVLSLILVLGMFTGCGDEETVPGTGEPGVQEQVQQATGVAYQAEFRTLELPEYDLEYINSFCYSGGLLYFVASCAVGMEPYVDPVTGEAYQDENGKIMELTVYDTVIFRMDPATMEVTALDYSLPELEEGMEGSSYVSGLYAGADGSIWFTEQTYSFYFDLPEDFNAETDDPYTYYTDNGTTYTCVQYDASGQPAQRIALEVPAEAYIGEAQFLMDGSIFATDWMNIYRFDNTGKLAGTLTLENGMNSMFPISDTQMGVSVWTEDGNVFQLLDPQTMTLGEQTAMPVNAYTLHRGFGDYEYLYENNGTVYGCKTGSTEGEKVLSWLDCDVDSSNIGSTYAFAEDGTVYALESVYSEDGMQYSLITLKLVDASTLPQKQVLTLACLYLDWDVRSDVIAFNKAHDDIRITVMDYSQYATEDDYRAGIQKLNTEILSGVVPDLFYITEDIPVDVYAARGVLQDLWPLIDADAELSREDLMEHFFEEFSMDGKLYQIADSFTIETVVGRRDFIGDADSWTLEELQQAYAAMPEGAYIFGETDIKSDMLYNCVEKNVNNFVDWANQQCSFDSQEFVDLLSFVNSFPAEFDYEDFDWEAYGSEGSRMRSGKQMLLQAYVSSLEQLQNYYIMCDGQPNFIGYPSTSGSGSTFRAYGSLAISAACKNTDAAWQFVRQYLTQEYQTQDYMWNFPTNRHSFETYVERQMTPEYETDPETGEQVEIAKSWYWFSEEEQGEIYAMTQAEYELLMDLYEKTTGVASYHEEINEIISTETEAFFAGQKTAQETADLIQNRASLYVFEQG